MISRAFKSKLRKAVDSYYAEHDIVTGQKIQIPKGFKLGKDGKITKSVYQGGGISAIIGRKKSKRIRVAKGPKA